MTSPPLDSTHGRTTSGIACHHSPWTANTVKQRQARHAIIAFRQHRRSDGVRRCMPSSPLSSIQSQTTLGVECHHRLWAAHTVERRGAWHAIIAFGLAYTVGGRRTRHAIISLGWQTQSNNVGRSMRSSPLGSTEGRTAFGVACHHRLWLAHTIERHLAWHAIISFGQHTRLNDIGRGMQSSPLGSTHG